MRKKGSALTIVLVMMTALLILGTAVSTAVVNTARFNKKYSDNIDLELAAKSGLNILIEDFITYASDKKIDEIKRYIDIDKRYLNIINNFSSNYDEDGIKLSAKIDYEDSSNIVIIEVEAKELETNISKKENQRIKINLSNN